jgi:Trypsin-co-occurring domain 1
MTSKPVAALLVSRRGGTLSGLSYPGRGPKVVDSIGEVAGMAGEQVWVQVVDVDVAPDREITFGKSLADGLSDRQDDIRAAVEAGSQTVAKSIEALPSPAGWRLGEVSAKFGITLTVEAGVIVSRASAGATFEVSVKFTRA